MRMKLPPRDLNPGPYPPHPTSTYTCEVTIAPRVCGGHLRVLLTSVIRAIINKSFKESFNTNFIGNRKSCQNINNFFFLIIFFSKITIKRGYCNVFKPWLQSKNHQYRSK